MNKLFALIGTTVGGYIGWLIGARLGLFTACMLSIVGTGVGLYGARRVAQNLLP